MASFYLFMSPKDIAILRNIGLRAAQTQFKKILKHYNRSRDEGLHLLHFEDYFDTPVEMICMALQMATASIDWKLLNAGREKLQPGKQKQPLQKSKRKKLSAGPAGMKKVMGK